MRDLYVAPSARIFRQTSCTLALNGPAIRPVKRRAFVPNDDTVLDFEVALTSVQIGMNA